jgi:phosphatidylinositol glycan class O
MDKVVPLALLAQFAFVASGHQATLVSLQWNAAFVVTSKVSYALSPLFIILNTFGPTALTAFAVPPRRNLERRPACSHGHGIA